MRCMWKFVASCFYWVEVTVVDTSRQLQVANNMMNGTWPHPGLHTAISLRLNEGGARKKISDPILSFWSKLGTGVREGFLYTPDTPQKNSEEKKLGGGRGGRWASEVSFRFFEQLSFSYLTLFVTAMALHTMKRDLGTLWQP